MKSLEEVIKYKLNFLPKETEPFYAIPTFAAERRVHGLAHYFHYYTVYLTKNTIFSYDSYSLVEDITSLFIYISSCDKYYRENGIGKIDNIFIKTMMEHRTVYEDFNHSSSHGLEEHRISLIKSSNDAICLSRGYSRRYTRRFVLYLKANFYPIQTEEEEEEEEEERRVERRRGEQIEAMREEEERRARRRALIQKKRVID